MTRENARDKAARYLTSGRVNVLAVGPGHVRATVRGDGFLWPVSYSTAAGWDCRCPARTDQCCHLLAVRLVCTPDLLAVA